MAWKPIWKLVPKNRFSKSLKTDKYMETLWKKIPWFLFPFFLGLIKKSNDSAEFLRISKVMIAWFPNFWEFQNGLLEMETKMA